MKKALSILMAGLVELAAGMPAEALAQHRGHYRGRGPVHQTHYRGYSRSHRGWSTAGSLLAGVVIGGMLQNACAAPPRREVVYTRTVYQTAPVVQYVQPAPVIHYVQPEPVVAEIMKVRSKAIFSFAAAASFRRSSGRTRSILLRIRIFGW